MSSSVDRVIGLRYYIKNNRREESIVRLIEKDISWIFNFVKQGIIKPIIWGHHTCPST